MAEITGANLQPIYNRLNSAPSYHPLEADTFADWSLEAGDIVTVTRDGQSYSSPIHTATHVWKGAPTVRISSTGDEEREPIAKTSRKKYNRSGSGLRNSAFLNQLISDVYEGLWSYFEVTSSRLRVEFYGLYDGLNSTFEITRSRLRAEFYGLYDGLNSNFEVTRSRMRAEFIGLYDGLSSSFEVTRSRMRAEFGSLYDGLRSEFEVTASRMRTEFNNLYEGLTSSFEVTASRMRTEFYSLYNGLNSNFEVTASRMRSEFYSLYDGLNSNFEVTASRMSTEFNNLYLGLSSNFEVTASRMHADFENIYEGLNSSFEVTASRMRTEFSNLYQGLNSSFEVTASRMRTEFSNLYQGLNSSFEVTASRMFMEFSGMYEGLNSNFEFTRSRWVVQFTDAYRGLSSQLITTASLWQNTIKDVYQGLSSRVEQTASSWGASISGVVGADGKVTAASIAIAINKNGSTARIAADRVTLDGTTSLNDVMTVLDNSVHINKTTYVGGTLYVTGGNGITLQTGGTPATNYNLTPTVMANMVVDAQVDTSTNTLKLWKITDDYEHPSITFSKAISSASWGWVNGAPRVTLSPQNQTFTGPTLSHSSAYQDDNDRWVMDVTYIDTSTTPPTYPETGHVIGLYNYLDGQYDGATATKKITENGTYTPGSAGSIDFIGFSKVVVDVTGSGGSVTGAWEQSNPSVSSNPYNKYTVRNESSAVVLSETVTTSMSYNSTSHKYTVTVNATGRNAIYTDEIADTDGYNRGWGAAVSSANMSIPVGQNTSTAYISVKHPTSTVGSNDTQTYTISNNNDNSVNLTTTVGSQTITVARFTHNKYNAGWGAAVSSTNMSIPVGQNTSTAYISVKHPTSTVGSNDTQTYTMSNNDDNSVNLTTTVGSQTITVARFTHNKWNAGWDSATSTTNLSIPTGQSTNSYITVKYPLSTSRGSNTTRTYTMDNDGDNAVKLYTSVSSQNITVAKFTHNKYTAGQNSVNVTRGNWTTYTSDTTTGAANVTYSPSAGSGTSKKLYITIGATGSDSQGTRRLVIRAYDDSTDTSPTVIQSRLITWEVGAWSNKQATVSVMLNGGVLSDKTITYTGSDSHNVTISNLTMGNNEEPDSSIYTSLGQISFDGRYMKQWATESAFCNSANERKYKFQIDGTNLYNKGRSDGYTAGWTQAKNQIGTSENTSSGTAYISGPGTNIDTYVYNNIVLMMGRPSGAGYINLTDVTNNRIIARLTDSATHNATVTKPVVGNASQPPGYTSLGTVTLNSSSDIKQWCTETASCSGGGTGNNYCFEVNTAPVLEYVSSLYGWPSGGTSSSVTITRYGTNNPNLVLTMSRSGNYINLANQDGGVVAQLSDTGPGTISRGTVQNQTKAAGLDPLASALGTTRANLTGPIVTCSTGRYYGVKITCGSATPKYYYWET